MPISMERHEIRDHHTQAFAGERSCVTVEYEGWRGTAKVRLQSDGRPALAYLAGELDPQTALWCNRREHERVYLRPEPARFASLTGTAFVRLLIGLMAGGIDPRHAGLDYRRGIPVPTDPQLHASISHSGSMVCAAVSRGAQVGIDVEPEHRAPELKSVLASLQTATAEHMTDRQLVEWWTAREAVYKALGVGIAGFFSPEALVIRGHHWSKGQAEGALAAFEVVHDKQGRNHFMAVACISMNPNASSGRAPQ
ncbi:4'-phosphopantetheinyl transferase family protein [Arthrobacter monumenti]